MSKLHEQLIKAALARKKLLDERGDKPEDPAAPQGPVARNEFAAEAASPPRRSLSPAAIAGLVTVTSVVAFIVGRSMEPAVTTPPPAATVPPVATAPPSAATAQSSASTTGFIPVSKLDPKLDLTRVPAKSAAKPSGKQ